MAKGSNNLAERRSSSRNAKPYDANNSFVKKVANKVTDFMPQRSWISKWFNGPQDNGDILNDNENTEDVEVEEVEEEVQKPPPLKRPRIRMDVTHPPGTFTIQPRNKNVLNTDESSKDVYSTHNDVTEDIVESSIAGPSGLGRLVSSTPAIQTNVRNIALQRSDLNSIVSAQNNGATNGTDDNSESSESTSGCSSLIPQINRQETASNISYSSPFTNRKRFVEDKLSFTNHLQSPRSLFLDSSSRDSLSNRRPSFNASMMTNTLDRASPLSSPFYSGNITFGGANAAGLFKRNSTLASNLNETKLRVPKRTSVQVKVSEATEVDSSGMSQTAKKILEALEHFSSPISDAKRIPVKNIGNVGTPSMGKKRSREEMSQSSSRVGLRHLTRELTVPTVPDMLKIRRRQKLQDTTVAARQIVSAGSGPPPQAQEYRLRSKNEDSKYRGKLRAKSKTNLEDEETVEAVNLPNIALPLTSLPNFNFTLPQSAPTTEKNSTSKDNYIFASPIKLAGSSIDLKSINNFSFSNPISAKEKKSLSNSSESFSKTSSTENNTSFAKCPPVTGQNFIWSGSSTAPKLKEKAKDSVSGGPKIAGELKAGSVMDVLNTKSEKDRSESLSQNSTTDGLVKFGDPTITNNNTDMKIIGSSSDMQNDTSVWECRECLIKNSNSVTRCVACKESKSSFKNSKVSQPLSTLNNASTQSKPVVNDCFGSQFKVHSNKKESTENWEKQNSTQTVNESKSQVGSELLEKFKPAKDSWECPGCMLRNAANVITCPCCKASKPSPIKITPKKKIDNTSSSNFSASSATSIASNVNISENQKSTPAIASTSTSSTLQSTNTPSLEKFKPKTDSWECPSCMVRNNDSASVCPCCSAPKPGGSSNITSTKTETAPVPGFGDKFKKPEGSWTCDSCMVQNDGKVSECVACNSLKPGAQKPTGSSTSDSSSVKFSFGIPSNAGEFKFGIDKANSTSKTDSISSASGFKFGENKPTSSEPTQFTFGIPKQEQKTTSEGNKANSGLFGNTNAAQSSPAFQPCVQNTENLDNHKKDNEAEKKTLPSFSFDATNNKEPVKSSSEQKANTAQQTTVTSGGFTFGLQKSTETKPETKNEMQKSLFANTAVGTPQSNTTVSNITSNAAANTSTSASILTTQTTTANIKALPTFSFGVSNTSVTSSTTMSLPAQSSFAFPKPQTTTTQSTTTPAFGQTPASSSATTFSFGSNTTTGGTIESAPKSTTQSFGTTTTAPLFATTPGSTPLFGNNEVKPTTAFGATEAKTPAFGINDNKPVVTFGSGENKPAMFAAPDTKIPGFGSIDKTTSSSAFAAPTPTATPASVAAPAFGQNTGTTTPLFGTSATPVFGNTTAPNFNAGSTPSTFPTATKPAEANASNGNLFTFGANRPATQSTACFNFTNTSGSTAQKSPFMFENITHSSHPFGGGTFNAPTPAPAPSPAPTTLNTSSSFTFKAPKPDAPPPAFGQLGTSVPVFGAPQPTPQAQSTSTFSSTPASNAGFNFGSTGPAAPSGGFNFGTPAPASAPSTGFNFNAPNATPAVAFDPNTRPSFNFTQGSAPTAFTASPQATSPAPRKIKKAIRRMR